ncbi:MULTISPECIES: hypothetical protein [Cellulomonas]|uniref:Uncharacterized protein n=1 Tax=Cellulomonas denverensis TaxID=264297 RepID=A0A7X6KY94_9CELL|nr:MULTISPECIES: hypothetical protein [Cellulomonas]NKY24406.1 hypothetical protein [Cellulomonas denverensis]QZN87735.1 hypothetical protein K5O09_18755 [Cellulomonas sp. C5510]GIG26493.1 hypothetical protein Cde04nite_27370 [Cellulomonas denverensis]
MSTEPAVSEADLVDELAHRALWSAEDAATLRTAAPWWPFGGRALRPALAALIWDHDLNRPGAPENGAQRLASVWAWIQDRALDVDAAHTAHQNWLRDQRSGARNEPEPVDPYRSAAASYRAERDCLPDPGLLRHAATVLGVVPDLGFLDPHSTATTHELLEQLTSLRAANLAAAPR